MKVTYTLNVSAKQFYEYLLRQIRTDIEHTKKESGLTIKQLDGYHYSKFLKRKKGNPMELKIVVGPLLENIYYEISYESESAHNKYFYDIRELDQQKIEVIYVEENCAKSTMNNWMYRLRTVIAQKSIEKKIIQALLQIETYILDHERISYNR